MTIHRCKNFLLLALTACSFTAAAAPGGPIGGIIVKGGKNPGGQMHVLATTDANGKFKLQVEEGGAYRFEFVAPDKAAESQRMARGFAIDYVIQARVQPAPGRDPVMAINRPLKVSAHLKAGELLLTLPRGGVLMSGTVHAPATEAASPITERAIQESGVSVAPTKPKGSSK